MLSCFLGPSGALESTTGFQQTYLYRQQCSLFTRCFTMQRTGNQHAGMIPAHPFTAQYVVMQTLLEVRAGVHVALGTVLGDAMLLQHHEREH